MRSLLLLAHLWLGGWVLVTADDAAARPVPGVHARFANVPKHAVLLVEVANVEAGGVRTGLWTSSKAEKVRLLVKDVPYRDETSSAFTDVQPGREVIAMVIERMSRDVTGPIGALQKGGTYVVALRAGFMGRSIVVAVESSERSP